MGSSERVSIGLENSRSWVHRWQVSVLFSKAVDHGFIAGIMVNDLILKVVYREFIGGVMISVLVSKTIDHGFITSVMVNVLVLKAV